MKYRIISGKLIDGKTNFLLEVHNLDVDATLGKPINKSVFHGTLKTLFKS